MRNIKRSLNTKNGSLKTKHAFPSSKKSLTKASTWLSCPKMNRLLSQLQNSSVRKIALLDRVEIELPRLPFSGRPPSARRKGYAFPSQPGPKSSIFRGRGVLQLAHRKKFSWYNE